MFALVFNGDVVQIEAQEFPVAPALEWVDITGIVPAPRVGWTHDGAVFAAPPAPPAPPSDADSAEQAIRSSPALLALGRIMTSDDALTEDALVTLVRAKLP